MTSDYTTDYRRGVRRAAARGLQPVRRGRRGLDRADRLRAGSQPLTEQGLVKAGGVREPFGDSLLVHNAGDPGYHKRSVTDALTVPVVAG